MGILFPFLVLADIVMQFVRWGLGMFVWVRDELGFLKVCSLASRFGINWSKARWVESINTLNFSVVGIWVRRLWLFLTHQIRYWTLCALLVLLTFLYPCKSGDFWRRLLWMWVLSASILHVDGLQWYPVILRGKMMTNSGVEDLVVQLEESLDLSAMEHGVKLVGKVLAKRILNKWGVRNILRSAWKEFGEVDVKWVRENVFVITVQDETMARRILDQVPWAVMKKNLSVKKWLSHLALQEVKMALVPFWVQI